MTQPQGHSTSGSHERYKTKERLRFEKEFDCIARMRDWMIESGIASESQIEGWEAADKEAVEAARDLAWEAFQSPIREERDRLVAHPQAQRFPEVAELTAAAVAEASKVTRSQVISSASRALPRAARARLAAPDELARFVKEYERENLERLQLASLQPLGPVAAESAGGARRVLRDSRRPSTAARCCCATSTRTSRAIRGCS